MIAECEMYFLLRSGGYTNNFGDDSAGNPTTFKGVGRSFNSNNQDTSFTFDNNGNPTTYKGVTLGFDVENRMTAYGSALTAGYRGDWLRAWKQASAGRTYFIYNRSTPIVELDSSGNVTAVNTYGVAGPLARRAGTSTFYQFDAQGSTAQRLDSSQNVSSSLMFDGYGVGSTSGGSDAFGYDAQWSYYTDLETGLHSLSYRYYDPGTGRFANRDPIRAGVNWYAYCGNTPTGYIDPSGLGSYVPWLPDGGGGGPGPGLGMWGPECTAEGIAEVEALEANAAVAEAEEGSVMRLVGAEEAEAIRQAGGLVGSINFPGGGATRVFEPPILSRMITLLPDTTHLIEMPVSPGWRLSIGQGGAVIVPDGPGFIVGWPDISKFQIGDPIITPLP